ncbi:MULTISPECIES: response regulator [unclassified Sphingopyxis]|uniref:response regulator n=1 Tax=unclassified Sphingopyxis TaxID=2614943 RepID=UPI000731315E|nr:MULTISPECIES: response regulator [unclassified Sphingopyxis]MBD3732928.1 response regulator [Sphingopyxis sp.]KTE23020.1 Phyllosphere-induced regulator PhyR [Sphingopyxis sp. H057]KTE49699.1 Phyllosphere-induced regulator PhyR [Sphingopyxis sp. H073]KTE54157.1 Phyllosphere-induced regulator PhyR [Sphingopyxis sp. H071]KTE57208.1 Phyllosphere-induced regulator PhyR [Sphingopyxis sp. H107]
MTLGDEIRGHLPFLRRYARALTGSQQHGDNFVHTTLEVIVAAPDEFRVSDDTRIDLYRNFHRIWESAFIEDGEGSDEGENPLVRAANRRLARITPLSRQMLLLTALEGFSVEETAAITGADSAMVETLLAEAVDEVDREARTSVLIIEDEPLIAMDLEQIVRDLGHEVAGVATTHEDAVAAFENSDAGLVLADIQLADGSSGIDAVQDILAIAPVPAIFITAFPEKLLTGHRVEPTFLISKPFGRNTVRAAISQSLLFTPQLAA